MLLGSRHRQHGNRARRVATGQEAGKVLRGEVRPKTRFCVHGLYLKGVGLGRGKVMDRRADSATARRFSDVAVHRRIKQLLEVRLGGQIPIQDSIISGETQQGAKLGSDPQAALTGVGELGRTGRFSRY